MGTSASVARSVTTIQHGLVAPDSSQVPMAVAVLAPERAQGTLFSQNISTARSTKGDVYSGDLIPGSTIKQGNGVMQYFDDSVYSGQWWNDARHGFGEYRWPSGTVYKGNFVNNQMHGHGKMKHVEDGVHIESYEGDFHQNIRQGSGKLILQNGDIYEGRFFANEFDGEGIMIFKNGDVYQGHWVDGRQHGLGKMIFHSGDIVDGEYHRGKLSKTVNIKKQRILSNVENETNSNVKNELNNENDSVLSLSVSLSEEEELLELRDVHVILATSSHLH